MQRGGLVTQAIERGAELLFQREQRRLGLPFGFLRRLVGEVQLRAVARREADGLTLISCKLPGELGCAFRLERRAFAELDRRLVVGDANEDDAHVGKWVTGRASRTTATSANPASRRYAERRPRHPAK